MLLNIDWDSSTIYQTPIFYNKNLTVGGKYFFYKSWFDSGICYIRDLLDDQGNFYEYNVFIQKRSIHTNFLQYHGVIESIKRFLRKKQANINNNMIGPIIPKVMYIILKHKKGSQNIYTILKQNKDEPTGKCKWNEIYTIDEKSWEYIFQAPFMILKCTKLRWFQTTINHRILTTNKLLFQMNLTDSPKCSFCGNDDETIDHLLWKCSKTQSFIQEMVRRFQDMSITLNLDEKTFILGSFPKTTSFVIQFLMLVAKYYINMNRSAHKHLNFLEYKINVHSLFLSHRETALKNNKLQEFLQAWMPVKEILDNII